MQDPASLNRSSHTKVGFPSFSFSCRLKRYCVFSVQSVQLFYIYTALVPMESSVYLSINFFGVHILYGTRLIYSC